MTGPSPTTCASASPPRSGGRRRSPRRPRTSPATSTCSCSTSRTRTSARSSATPGRPRTSTACCRRASLLADFFAEEHPSDGNYLALAGGSTFGIPLDDPLEENPQYTIQARNIGDLVDAAHETWKGYLQSANGPCDDTVHGYYWNDDLPMTYFADVRDRPAYCAAHLVPLQSLRSDLASAATTPNFAWVGPNDCTDMEGCGIRAGDEFLARELGAIMRSPAWRTQRSLAIITFDEDGYDHQHPAQRVPTLILGSAGVRRGYVSHVRYTHYSLLRTIEAALGLGTLTSERPLRPAGQRRVRATGTRPGRSRPAGAWRDRRPRRPTRPAPARRRRRPSRPQAMVVVRARHDKRGPADGLRGELRLGHGHAGRPGHPAGGPGDQGRRGPAGDRGHPDGRPPTWPTAGSGTVTPIDTATRRAGPPIRVGHRPARDRDHPGRPDRLRGELRLGHGHADRHRHPPRRRPRSGSAPARGRSRSPPTAGPPTCWTGAARRSRRSTPPPAGPPGHPGGQLPVRDRDRAGWRHRLRRQLRLGHGHPDHHRHRAARAGHPGRPGAGRARRDPGRPDRLRGRRRLRRGHPDHRGHRARRPPPSRWGTRRPRSRSRAPAGRRTW